MSAFRPDPKPVTEGGIGRKKPDRGNRRRGRVTASRDRWIELRAEKLAPCRIHNYYAPVGWVYGEQLHHLIPRSRAGDDVADNLVPLCLNCHDRVTRNERVALASLAASLTDSEYAYIVGKLGEGGMARLFGVGR